MKRTYTIPLRRGFRNTQRNMRAKKAVRVTKEFLQKHMKSDTVKLGSELNDTIWKRGIKNPPGKVTVDCEKTEDGIVYANLHGHTVRERVQEEPQPEKQPEKKAKASEKESEEVVGLASVKGLGPSKISALNEAGITNAKELLEADIKELSAVEGVGEATAEKLQEAAKEALNK